MSYRTDCRGSLESIFPDRQDRLFGRDADVVRLVERASLPGITAVTGRARMGKTWVAQELARRLGGSQTLVGYHEATGGESHVLRAVSDLYGRWLRQSTFADQAASLWDRHKDGLIGKVGRTASAIFEPLKSLGVPGAGGIIRVLEGLGHTEDDLRTAGLALKPLEYEQARAITTLVARLGDRPTVLILDGWEHSATVEADRQLLDGFQRHIDDWGPLHVYLLVRHPLDAQADSGSSEAMKAARSLVSHSPAINRLVELGGMALDAPIERARLLGSLRANVHATKEVDDAAILAMIDGYPGVLADWQSPNLSTTMQREADLRDRAADAQQNRYADLAGLLAALDPPALRLAARLASFLRLDAARAPVWIDSAGDTAPDTIDHLTDAGVLSDEPSPTFGHDTRHVAAQRWFRQERARLLRREAEAAIGACALRVTGVDEASRPFLDLMVACDRTVLDEASDAWQLVSAARTAFGGIESAMDPGLDAWLLRRKSRDGLSPMAAIALINRGYAKARAGDPIGAQSDFGAVIGMPDAPGTAIAKARLGRGASKVSCGDPDGGGVDFDALIAMSDAPAAEAASALFNRGIARARAKDAGAIADFDALLALPGAPSGTVLKALAKRSVLLAGTGRVDDAIADWNRVIGMRDATVEDIARALFNRSLTHAREGLFDDARAGYDAIIATPGAPKDMVANAAAMIAQMEHGAAEVPRGTDT